MNYTGHCLSQELLKKLIRYDSVTGECFWRKRSAEFQKDLRLRNTWNTKHSGKVVGFVNKKTGCKKAIRVRKTLRFPRKAW